MHARKFRTFVLTKGNIRRCAAIAAGGAAAVCCAAVFRTSAGRVEGVLPDKSSIYTAILSDELPVTDKREKKHPILGFDISNGRSIILSCLPVFGETEEASPIPEDHSTKQLGAESTAPPAETSLNTPAPSESITVKNSLGLTNATSYQVDVNALAEAPLPFSLDDDGPQVLIIHTHTTEAYSDSDPHSINDRSTDPERSIVSVGDVIEKVLTDGGIDVVHDRTVHDYPSYNGSYTRALATIKKNIGEYPSIKIVLDVHRDGIVREDGTKVKVVTDIDGDKCAQVMIVAGSDASGLAHDNWRDNMTFAAHIQKAADEAYPTLMRPINLREERFNTHMTRGSIILEVGSNGNTLDEAKRGARYAAEAILKTLKE